MSGIFDQVINYAPPSLLLGTVTYKGTWSAATNTPTLVNPPSSITNGNYYVVSAAGTQFSLSFNIGDWIISNGTAWEKVDNTDAVSSVFTRTGAVVASNGDYTASNITNVPSGNLSAVTVQAALDELDADISSAQEILTATVTNAESTAITRGQVVYVFSATGNRISVKLASNASEATSSKTFGVVTDASIAAGTTGLVTCVGTVTNLSIGSFTDGQTVYLGTAGAFTATKPVAPAHMVYVGFVERANAGNGELYVKIQNGYELDELHDVLITGTPAAGSFIIRDATNSLWKNATLTAGTNIAVTNADAAVTVGLTGTVAVANGGTGVTTSTGSGDNVLSTSPTLVTPILGTPTSGTLTNCTGTASGLTAGNVTTNANLTGDVTSVGNATTLTNAPVIAKVLTGYVSGAGTVAATDSILQAIQKLNGNDATNANLTGVITSSGNATSIASQTGTGTKFVVDTSPTLVTPNIGVATGTSLSAALNGSLGATTPSTVAATTGTFTGTLSATGNITGSGTVGIVNNSGYLMKDSAGNYRTMSILNGSNIMSFGDTDNFGAAEVRLVAGTGNPLKLYGGNTLVGTFTSAGAAITGTLSATGAITQTGGGGAPITITGATTGATLNSIANSGGTSYWGLESSAGGTFTGTTSYSFILGSGSNRSTQIIANATKVADFSSTGLAVTGAITATGNITAYFSDDRLKTKLGNIENALDKVCSLDGFYYEANETAQALGYKPVREVGLSAQSVQKVLPEVIAPAPIDAQYMTMHYERVIPLLVEAIKELRAEVASLKKCNC